MTFEADLQQLILAIHDAALAPDGWPGVLDQLGDLLRGSAAVLGLQVLPEGGGVSAISRFDPETIGVFEREYMTRDRNSSIQAMLAAPIGTWLHGYRAMSEPEWRSSDLRRDVYAPNDLWHAAPVCLLRQPEYMAVLSIARSYRGGEFNQRDAELMGLLIPHFQRALQTHLRLRSLDTERTALADALDQLSFAVILVDTAGRAVRVNRRAEALLSARDGLQLVSGHIVASTRDETRALTRFVHGATRLSPADVTASGGALRLRRPSGRKPLSVLVAPLASATDPLPSRPVAAVFVSDPEHADVAVPDILQAVYGLTAQEASLAALLARGESLATAAELLGITRNTAHTHLQHVFDRTDTHRQADLVRLVLRSPAGLAGAGHP